MTVFGIKPDNYFGDVVLAAADRDGLRIFQYAVRSAMRVVRQLST